MEVHPEMELYIGMDVNNSVQEIDRGLIDWCVPFEFS
jgi:hypothetical protein